MKRENKNGDYPNAKCLISRTIEKGYFIPGKKELIVLQLGEQGS